MNNEITIELNGLTTMQCAIADFLFLAETDEDLELTSEAFGSSDVEIVKQLMLAAAFDNVKDVSEANEILQSISR